MTRPDPSLRHGRPRLKRIALALRLNQYSLLLAAMKRIAYKLPTAVVEAIFLFAMLIIAVSFNYGGL